MRETVFRFASAKPPWTPTEHRTEGRDIRSKPLKLPMIQREQQFAEKIHAYTLPRSLYNVRISRRLLLTESSVGDQLLPALLF